MRFILITNHPVNPTTGLWPRVCSGNQSSTVVFFLTKSRYARRVILQSAQDADHNFTVYIQSVDLISAYNASV